MPETAQLLRSFGRKRGRRLRVTKQGLMDTLLPRLRITLPDGILEPANLFPSPPAGEGAVSSTQNTTIPHPNLPPQEGKEFKEFWLEIGFGGGEHLAHQAMLNPSIGIIGCEPYENGMAGLLTQIDTQALDNIRVFSDDARLLLEKLPDASISRVFILYPDPWPKTRHHKRRLISTQMLDMLARILKPGAQLRVATDHEDYGVWILEHLLPYPIFSWTAKSCSDWLSSPTDWLSTRYEQKAFREGRVATYLNFIYKN